MQSPASTTDDIVQLFVDTNAFIQLRDLKDVPWRELFPEAVHVDILVSQTVITELDKLKSGTNGRRRDRARLALKLINAASRSPDFALDLPQKSGGRLRLVIADGPVPDWSKLPRLDPNRADDRLVAEVKCYGDSVALLSHDSGPLVRARIVGVHAFEPPHTWLLPEERTDDQRKIAQLERQLDAVMSTSPQISATFGTLESPKEIFDFTIPILPPLTPEAQTQLVAAYLDCHPPQRREEKPHNPSFLFDYTRRGDTPRSYNLKLDEFEKSVVRYFLELHKTMGSTERVVSIPYAIKNDSRVAANGLRIEVHVDGDASLFANRDDAEAFLGATSPPKLPEFEHDRGAFDYIRTANMISLQANQPRDPTEFYWFERPEYGARHSALQCADYRATRLMESNIWLYPEDERPFTVTFEISATNLPVPIAKTATVSRKKKKLEWSDPIVKMLLPKEIVRIFDIVV